MTNIDTTLNQTCGAMRVPSTISTAPLNARPANARARAGRLPGKSAVISSDTAPKMLNSGVCEPPPTAKPIAAAIGSTTPARAARRSASYSGSRSRSRSAARRQSLAGVSSMKFS